MLRFLRELRWLVPSSSALLTDEPWVRKQLARHDGRFTYRIPVAGQAWDPGRSTFDPLVGPAEVTYSEHADGTITASIERPRWAK